MNVLLVLGVLVIFPIIHILSCVSTDTSNYSLRSSKKFDIDELKQYLNQLSVDKTRDVCRVTAIIDHIELKLILDFSSSSAGKR